MLTGFSLGLSTSRPPAAGGWSVGTFLNHTHSDLGVFGVRSWPNCDYVYEILVNFGGAHGDQFDISLVLLCRTRLEPAPEQTG